MKLQSPALLLRKLIDALVTEHNIYPYDKDFGEAFGLSATSISRLRNPDFDDKQHKFNFQSRQVIIDNIEKAHPFEVVENANVLTVKLLLGTPRSHGPAFPHIYLACTASGQWVDNGHVLYSGIFQFSENWQKVKIEYFNQPGKEPFKIQYGSVVNIEGTLVLSVDQNEAGPFPKRDQKKRFLRGMFCFKGDSGSQIYHGVFSTLSKERNPVCGEIILEKSVNLATAKQKIMTKALPLIQFNLIHKRWRVMGDTIQTEKELPFLNRLNLLKKKVGYYRGYYLSTHHETICEVQFIIRENGTVALRSNPNDRLSRGIISWEKNDNLLVAMDYAQDDQRFPHLMMGLRAEKNELSGFWASLSEAPIPTAGRAFFKKINAHPEFPESKPVYYKVKQEREKIRDLFKEEKNLHSFFSGRKDNYLDDGAYRLRDFDESGDVSLFEMEGIYEWFWIEIKTERFIQTVLEISPGGKARLKSATQPNYVYEGRVWFSRNNLLGYFRSNDSSTDPLISFCTKEQNGFWQGTYSGSMLLRNEPTGGLLQFRKAEEVDFNTVSPTSYLLNNAEESFKIRT